MRRTAEKKLRRCLLLIIFFMVGFIVDAVRQRDKQEPFTIPELNDRKNEAGVSLTSTKFRYRDGFKKTLGRYQGFQKLYKEKFSTAIPGLEYALIDDFVCGQMVPQGICLAGDFMLVTAYDNTRKYMQDTGKRTQYQEKCSVIYVLSNEKPKQRELLTTIVLPDVNHVGGIAFDGNTVWIAKSTTKKLSAIDYRIIWQAAFSGKQSYKLENYTVTVDCGVTASFLTYADSKLWVGTYQNLTTNKGGLRCFDIIRENQQTKLALEYSCQIPAYANGVAIAEISGRHYMAIVSSQGRYVDSKIYLYEMIRDKITNRKLLLYLDAYRFPPMAEEVAYDGKNLYFLFESSATCYSTLTVRKCSYVVDRICAVPAEKLFHRRNKKSPLSQENQENNYIYNYIRDCAYIHERKLIPA